MKIAIAQTNPCIGDFEGNIAKIKERSKQAADRGCDLVVFPELAVCGYPPGDLMERREFLAAAFAATDKIVQEINGIAVICGNITKNVSSHGKPLHSSAILFENGRIIKIVHKRLLPTYDVFDETRYFEPGLDSSPFKFHDIRIGITICEDIWNDLESGGNRHSYTVNPVREICVKGCDIMFTISASPYKTGRLHERRAILERLADKYGIPFVYSNMTGGQDSLVFDGGSMAVTPGSRLKAMAADFREDMVTFDLNGPEGEIHPVSTVREEEIIKALSLALKDYLRRCNVSKVALGLSGGIDSALTAAIAAEALGPENVLALLMPSKYTSLESIEDAEQLASNLGIIAETVPISDMVTSYKHGLSELFSGRKEDVTEENIQARIRGDILMAVSNKFGHMVLATGNKSESAVGYCTLYGDMSGGFALISDVPKTMVYELSEYINREREIIPRRIIEKAPTAELRPGQTDQDELPSYEILDAVLEMYMEKGMTIEEISRAGIDKADAEYIVGRIVRNEYKRQQAAMGPRITSRAFVRGWQYPVAHCFSITGGNS